MYKGKRTMKITHMSKRAALLVLSLVTVLTISVSGTLAYLIRATDSATNSFIPGEVTTETTEEFEPNGEKSNVQVENSQNKGSLPVYVRAKVVLCWVDEDGEKVLSEPVTEGMANMDWGNKWTLGADGYRYYQEVLMPGASTENLINSCEPSKEASPVDARLQVTILTQSIQAYGSKTAVESAWGITAANLLPPAYVPTQNADSNT